jgi:hypothetical protein
LPTCAIRHDRAGRRFGCSLSRRDYLERRMPNWRRSRTREKFQAAHDECSARWTACTIRRI